MFSAVLSSFSLLGGLSLSLRRVGLSSLRRLEGVREEREREEPALVRRREVEVVMAKGSQ